MLIIHWRLIFVSILLWLLLPSRVLSYLHLILQACFQLDSNWLSKVELFPFQGKRFLHNSKNLSCYPFSKPYMSYLRNNLRSFLSLVQYCCTKLRLLPSLGAHQSLSFLLELDHLHLWVTIQQLCDHYLQTQFFWVEVRICLPLIYCLIDLSSGLLARLMVPNLYR